MAKTKKSDKFDFETAFADLEKIVVQMEEGGLSLEDSLQQFEQGISLVRECQTALKTAEQKVQILLNKNGQSALENLNIKDETEE